MSIRNRLSDDMKQAMKNKETDRLSVIRMALAKFKEADIEFRVKGIDTTPEPDLIVVLTKMVKQRRDSAKIYSENGRTDAETKELAEVDILNAYLPKALTEEEVQQAILKAIQDTQASGASDTGKVVARLKELYSGQIDFSKVVGQIKLSLSQ